VRRNGREEKGYMPARKNGTIELFGDLESPHSLVSQAHGNLGGLGLHALLHENAAMFAVVP